MNIWRDVEHATLRSGRGSFLEPAARRRTRWWDLTLTCGHRTERHARYRKADPPLPQGTRRSADDVLPPVVRVACLECRQDALKEMFS